MKEYNAGRHYETEHPTYTSYTDAEPEEKVKHVAASLLAQQQYFPSANKIQEITTRTSYEVAQLIARHGKPFSDGNFIKLHY